MGSAAAPDDASTLLGLSLEVLEQQCAAQLAAFQRSRDQRQDCRSCEEILRRAAEGDSAAFALLWQFTIPFVRQNCPPQCRDGLDDLQQEVALRLTRKFLDRRSPYRAGAFAQYRSYVNTTIKSVCLDAQRSSPPAAYLLAEQRIFHTPSMVEAVLRQAFYNRCEALLPDALHREAFRRRFVRDEAIADILSALRQRNPALTTQQVYRLLERCMELLKAHPEVREMLESAGGNT